MLMTYREMKHELQKTGDNTSYLSSLQLIPQLHVTSGFSENTYHGANEVWTVL
jgi:hypothetical protein